MKTKILDFIRQLSLDDPKTLTQKAAKITEENGELSRIVLPYEGASGTLHRFTDQEAILEESVDIILAAISLPYQLGFTHEDIEAMMAKKAAKWKGLQIKESKIEGDIPFEIHVTFGITNQTIEGFKNACNQIGVKPIVIDLENQGETVMRDVMTSSVVYGGNLEAILAIQEIRNHLEGEHGYVWKRSKVETIPWHPMAPQSYSDTMPGDCYFEAHVGCIVTSEEDKEFLQHFAQETGSHLSRNPFKKLDDGSYINMVTLRRTQGCLEDFDKDLKEMTDWLDRQGIEYKKVEREFAVYDTNINHDFLWTQKQEATI